jgi:DNA-binding IclR family transcriptional regulator
MTTLSSAADVLRCYSDERRDLTVTQVSRLLEMPKSNASRLLRAMAACGLLETVGASKRYRPGVAVYEAGRQYRLTSPFAAHIDEAAARVSEKLRGTVSAVSVIERDGPFVLSVAERGAEGLIMRPAAPRRIATAVAPGQVLLARLGDEAIRAMFARPWAGFAPLADDIFAEASRSVAQARRRGFASLADGKGGIEIAVALGDPTLRKDAALCVVAREGASATDIARALHEICATLATTLRDSQFGAFNAE